MASAGEPEPSAGTDPAPDGLRDLLVAERALVARNVEGLRTTYAELVAAADLEPPDDEHDPNGTTAYERAQVGSLAEAGGTRLDALDAAIAAVDRGVYGRCVGCDAPIPAERLVAVLGTTTCVTCAPGGRRSAG